MIKIMRFVTCVMRFVTRVMRCVTDENLVIIFSRRLSCDRNVCSMSKTIISVSFFDSVNTINLSFIAVKSRDLFRRFNSDCDNDFNVLTRLSIKLVFKIIELTTRDEIALFNFI